MTACESLGHYYADRSGGLGWPSCVICGKPVSLTEQGENRPCCNTRENTPHTPFCRSVAAQAERNAQPPQKGSTVNTPTPVSADELRRQAATLLAEASSIERAVAEAELARREALKPKMPSVESGPAYVAFSRYASGREYQYAAVGWREGRSVRWMVTGATTDRFNWAGLVKWIGEANWPTLRVLTPDAPLVEPGDEPPVAERMGSFGRVLSTVDPLRGDEGSGYGRY